MSTTTSLSKRVIEKLAVPTAGRAFHRDGRTIGFGVVIHHTGKRVFFWNRKVRGYPRWESIGNFPELSVDLARARADELNARLAQWSATKFAGPDPFKQQDEITLAKVVDLFVEQRIKPYSKRAVDAEKRFRQRIDFYIPSWKTRTLSSITSEDVAAIHRDIGRTRHRAANMLVVNLTTLYRFALQTKIWKGENPATGIKHFRTFERTRFLQPKEMPLFWTALRKSNNQEFKDFVVIALFTGARRSDVLSMRWTDLQLDESTWTVPNPKAAVPYEIALDREVVEILKRRGETKINQYVFPGSGERGYIVAPKRHWKQLLEDSGLTNLKMHDLRRTFASWQVASGTTLQVIAKSLGHSSIKSTQIYSRVDLTAVRASMQRANDAMRQLPAGSETALPGAATGG